ncbi:hypothetical protein SCOCK_30123 [Actinacidiphila cocklensis]|uniref:Uncharacterized protein n=1 Tax=Actinacidiphila cocklensis TaxID=887465 RepID=A0A9W4DRG1_9ACTN|nr:hypothetical protein SCOCK_30123 [Actinacidiphila cocklensis]
MRGTGSGRVRSGEVQGRRGREAFAAFGVHDEGSRAVGHAAHVGSDREAVALANRRQVRAQDEGGRDQAVRGLPPRGRPRGHRHGLRRGGTRREAGRGRGPRPVHLDVPRVIQDDLARAEEGPANRDGRPAARRHALARQGRDTGRSGQGLHDLQRRGTRRLHPGVPQERLVHHLLMLLSSRGCDRMTIPRPDGNGGPTYGM